VADANGGGGAGQELGGGQAVLDSVQRHAQVEVGIGLREISRLVRVEVGDVADQGAQLADAVLDAPRRLALRRIRRARQIRARLMDDPQLRAGAVGEQLEQQLAGRFVFGTPLCLRLAFLHRHPPHPYGPDRPGSRCGPRLGFIGTSPAAT
jgi:hypothetical protein